MRAVIPMSIAIGCLSCWVFPLAAGGVDLEKVMVLLERRCVECHRQDMNEGGLVMETREELIKGGDSGAALVPGERARSELFKRVCLPGNDGERMPPESEGEALGAADVELLGQWIDGGAQWPQGRKLSVATKNELPPWNAPADPKMVAVEISPKEIRLEGAGDVDRVKAIVRMRDQTTHDITHVAKWSLADPSLVRLDGTELRSLKDGTTVLRVEYRGLVAEVPVSVSDKKK